MRNTIRKLGALTALGAALALSASAGTRTWTFDDWYSFQPWLYELGFASSDGQTVQGYTYMQTFGGNPDSGGFLELTPALEGRNLAVVFPDIDAGAPVKAFRISMDVRAGNGTDRPADGFSISFVRDSDPALSNAVQVVNVPPSPPYPGGGNMFGFAGGDSDAVALDPLGSGLPENGAKTGLAIAFDVYQGNRLPDTGPNGTPGPDVEGIAVRVDDRTLVQVPLGQRHAPGFCADTNSMQTGPYDTTQPGAWYGVLEWCRLEVEKTADNKVSVTWKGRKILENYQLTTYTPHRGRLILAGRTGGANQNVHFDNIELETTPAIEPTLESVTINSDFKGLTFTLKDTPPSRVSVITQVLLNGVNVTASVLTNTTGDITTGVYTQADPFPPGSVQALVITFGTTLGQTLTVTGQATTPNYFRMPLAYKLPESAVTGQPRGIALGQAWQTIAENRNSQGENKLNWTEEQLLGLWGANLATIPGPASVQVMDYQNSGADGTASGNFRVNGSSQTPALWDGPDYSITSAFGIGSNPAKLNTDDGALEWFAYVKFPAAGSYVMVVNSDDGFRLTTARHARDRLGDVISYFDTGRGNGTGVGAGTHQTILIEEPGIYPIRGLIFNRGGGFNVEWYTRVGDQLHLVNGANAPALEAWTQATGLGAYVQSAIPVRSAVDVLPGQKIRLELANGTHTVTAGSITLKVDGIPVSPTITPGVTTIVEQAPIGPHGFWSPGTHTIELAFTDSDGKAYSYLWRFSVGAYQLYQGPHAANGQWNLYLVIRSVRTWVMAEAAARSMVESVSGQSHPGHLASIRSAGENSFVQMLANGQSVWIGLTDREAYGGEETGAPPGSAQVPPATGRWVWVSGEPYTYANWNGGEPNNAGTGEDAVELTSGGGWNDNLIGIPPEGQTTRQYVVEFPTALPEQLPDVFYSILPPGPLPGPEGCDGVFGIRAVRDIGTIASVIDAVASLYNPSATISNTTSPVVNFGDLDGQAGGGGIFPGNLPLPGNRPGDDDHFVLVAKTRINITEAGDYTFGIHSDEGFALRIRDEAWTSVSGGGQFAPGDPSTLVFQAGTGDSNTRGVINLGVGVYELEFLWFEITGGAYVELYAAKGAYQCDGQTTAWRLVGYQPQEPPAMLVNVGVSAAGWTVEYSTPGASGGLNSIAEAEAALVSAPSVTGVFQINYQDPQAGGGPGCSDPFPQDTAAADDDFAIRATAELVIPVAGTYYFGFAGDDGGYLQIQGQSWNSIVSTEDAAIGIINGDRIQFDANTGNSRTVGSITLVPGSYTMRALFWERGGGAWFVVSGGLPGGLVNPLRANGSPLVADQAIAMAACTAAPAISIARSGGNLVIHFTGRLLASDTADGPYEEVTGATSPYPVPPTGAARFYRAAR